MTTRDTPHSNKSVAVTGDNMGVVNTGNIENLTINNVSISQIAELSSYLSEIVFELSDQTILSKPDTTPRQLPPSVEAKLQYNQLNRNMALVDEWRTFGYMLANILSKSEINNPAVSVLMRRNLGFEYRKVRDKILGSSIQKGKTFTLKAGQADDIIDELIAVLITKIPPKIKYELAHFAVGIVVVDAIVDCSVLEKP